MDTSEFITTSYAADGQPEFNYPHAFGRALGILQLLIEDDIDVSQLREAATRLIQGADAGHIAARIALAKWQKERATA